MNFSFLAKEKDIAFRQRSLIRFVPYQFHEAEHIGELHKRGFFLLRRNVFPIRKNGTAGSTDGVAQKRLAAIIMDANDGKVPEVSFVRFECMNKPPPILFRTRVFPDAIFYQSQR